MVYGWKYCVPTCQLIVWIDLEGTGTPTCQFCVPWAVNIFVSIFEMEWSMELLILIASCLPSITAVRFETFDYCKHPCESGPHTVCISPEGCHPVKTCHNWHKDGQLTDYQKDLLLKRHNQLRNLVAIGGETRGLNFEPQPSASNMRELEWDRELEYIALCHVHRCKFEHDACRDKADGTSVGQNLLVSSSEDVDDIVTTWENEVVEFDPKLVSRFVGNISGIGHYTQVVWAETAQIGCARSTYTEDGMRHFLTACNYAPSGNVEGYPVYRIGKRCSNCPKGTVCTKKFNGLCSVKRVLPYAASGAFREAESLLHFFVVAAFCFLFLHWQK